MPRRLSGRGGQGAESGDRDVDPYGGSTTTSTDPTGAVPDVTGQSLADAEAALVAAGYTWALNGTTASSQAAGMVASTSPAAGTAAAAGSHLTIQTSDGTG